MTVSEIAMEGMAALLVAGKLDVALVRGPIALPAEVARRGGFTLERTQRAGSLTEVLAQVLLGNGVAVVPAILSQTVNLPGICYRDIAGEEITSVLWLLHRKRERMAVITNLLALTKEVDNK